MNVEALTLRGYLAVLRRRKWIVLIPIVIAPLVAFALSKLEAPRYSASADVLITQLPNLQISSGGVSVSTDPARIIATQTSVAQSQRVVDAAAKAVKLTPGEFLSKSGVTGKTDQDILVFTVQDRYPAVAQRLVNVYAQKYVDYATTIGTRQFRTTLLNEATGASQVAPTPTRNALLGLLLGVVVGIGLAFVRDHLDTRVRNATEVSNRLGLPLLARLPEPPKHLRRDNRLVMLEEPTSHAAEPFRVLATNLEFVAHELKPRTIMVTSAREGEGKSTTAANLAATLARSGKRVALVDLDLRRPFLHEFFHIPPEPGLTTMAVGRATLAEALVGVPLHASRNGEGPEPPAEGGKLQVLCSGRMPPNPGEFVRSRGVGRLIDHLAEHHDSVIIDAAPLLGLGDSLVLIPRVDATLLVTRLEMLHRPTLNELHRVLESTNAKALGIIATAAEREADAYGYGYGYAYGAYGYGSASSPNGYPLPLSETAQHEELR